LPLPRNGPARLRSVRRTFAPSPAPGPYRLPHDVRDRLASALAPYRNRDAAYDLATFIARFWSSPSRIARTFVIDRRALTNVSALDLTEARVRGAIRVLEEVGFVDRAVTRGSPYHPTPEGLRRKPVEFQFGPEYVSFFVAANRRAREARERRLMARPLPIPVGPWRPSTPSGGALPGVVLANSPKSTERSDLRVYLGENRSTARDGAPARIDAAANRAPSTPRDPKLEAALDRWKKAAEGAGVIKVAAPVRFAEEPRP
jgi:hypothetical protein